MALWNWQNKKWLSADHHGTLFRFKDSANNTIPGGVYAKKDTLDGHCEWELKQNDDGNYSLKAHHEKYLVPTGVVDSEKNPPSAKPHVNAEGHHSAENARWIVTPCATPPPKTHK